MFSKHMVESTKGEPLIILSHRGFWQSSEEKNSITAFERSFQQGFGLETDLRDQAGKLVISHDPASSESLPVDDFFKLYNEINPTLPLALNIKADGLQKELTKTLKQYKVSNYFVFDMSVPDALIYTRGDFNVFTRQSEYEQHPSLYQESEGIWLDEFIDHWIEIETIEKHLKQNKKVCIVSPELHGREYQKEWDHYRIAEKQLGQDSFMLCTDLPHLAKEFFNA